MHVEVTFPEIGPADLELHMSRSSPGRYALHEFAKNVYDVVIVGGGDRGVTITRPSLHEWRVAGHGGTVRVRYKVYGDQLDGTYLAIDATHAHINMPAALMWARGFEDRPSHVAIEPPPGSDWRVATQLFAGEDGLTFTAPNLQYLMDSPIEVSRHTVRDFSVTRGTARTDFRLALHGGSDDDASRLASDLEKIAREEGAIFGEFPRYDVGRYTFLADCLPWADGDAMEHRNSTIITVPGSPADSGARSAILSNAAHELFHGWSVERIRPRSLEPFNLADANMSPELWLAEGVTSYYELLVMHRARLQSLSETLTDFAALINQVTNSPARRIRSAQEMSRLAPFVDAAVAVDRTNWGNTFISYYTWGAAIGLGLDLALRDRTDGRVTLDDFQRDLWTTFGKPGGRQPGFVDRPYTSEDVTARLAAVSGDAAFAEEFINRYVAGHEVPDYERLLSRAGLALVARSPRTRMDRRSESGLLGRRSPGRCTDADWIARLSGRPRSGRCDRDARRRGVDRSQPARRCAAAPRARRDRANHLPTPRRSAGCRIGHARGRPAPGDRDGRVHGPTADGGSEEVQRRVAGQQRRVVSRRFATSAGTALPTPASIRDRARASRGASPRFPRVHRARRAAAASAGFGRRRARPADILPS